MIFILRNNILEHLLSHLLSFATYRFYEPQGLRFEAGSVVARKQDFESFLIFLSLLRARRAECPDAKVIVYEDFIRDGAEATLQKIGFTETLNWSGLRFPAKQNRDDKLSIFSNKDEVISWYCNLRSAVAARQRRRLIVS
jgi:hypothetical protein